MNHQEKFNYVFNKVTTFFADHKGASSGVATMTGLGMFLGSSIGIAAGPLGACAGTIPGGILGAVIGLLAGDKVDSFFVDTDEPVAATDPMSNKKEKQWHRNWER